MDGLNYAPLQAWLNSADEHYIAGRFVGINSVFLVQSCICSWLGFEQIFKTLIFQKVIEENAHGCKNSKALSEYLEKLGRQYSHKYDALIDQFKLNYPDIDISMCEKDIRAIRDFYDARYPTHRAGSIGLNKAKRDELYFKLRDLVNPKTGQCLIEKIYINMNMGWPQEKGDEFAFHRNPYFRPRPFAAHEVYCIEKKEIIMIDGYPK